MIRHFTPGPSGTFIWKTKRSTYVLTPENGLYSAHVESEGCSEDICDPMEKKLAARECFRKFQKQMQPIQVVSEPLTDREMEAVGNLWDGVEK